jgi:hypothetical protein
MWERLRGVDTSTATKETETEREREREEMREYRKEDRRGSEGGGGLTS